MAITHKKVSTKPDSSDAAIIQPSDWNDGHDITDFIIDITTPAGAIDGSNSIFILPSTPNPIQSLELFWNGVLCTQNIEYSLSTNIITMKYPHIPGTGDTIQTKYRKD